jgi:butyrate kinase
VAPSESPRRILTINPGSTSTKVALFEDEAQAWFEEIDHDAQELAAFPTMAAQLPLRQAALERVLGQHRLDYPSLSAVVGRGGLLHPLSGGTYRVDADVVEELLEARYGQHASNLGAPLAAAVARRADCPAFFVDPVVTDELADVARDSGLPERPRRSLFHALNQRAMALRAADLMGMRYQDLRLVVAHMGGGITVGLHDRGRVVEVNNALDGDGPFAAERSGALPLEALWTAALRHRIDLEEVLRRRISGHGGLVDLMGTNDLRRIPYKGRGGLVRRALALGIAREIGRRAAIVGWPVDALVLTGGLAHDERLMRSVLRHASWVARRHFIFPGEAEMLALAQGALRVLRGKEPALDYARTHA